MLHALAVTLSLLAAEVKVRPIPQLKDSVNLLRVEADPGAYVGKEFYICGAIRSQSYYNYSYRDTESLFYSLSFEESGKDTVSFTGKEATLYLPRRTGAPIMDKLLHTQEKLAVEGIRASVICQVKVFLAPDAYEEFKQWNIFEVRDVRFIAPDFSDFQPWLLHSLAKQEMAERDQKRWKSMLSGGGSSRSTSAKKPKAPLELRTWTDSTGQHKTTARFAGLAMGTVTLQLDSGKTVTVPLERLSKEDQDYIKQQR